jgi:hypothetical protein
LLASDAAPWPEGLKDRKLNAQVCAGVSQKAMGKLCQAAFFSGSLIADVAAAAR